MKSIHYLKAATEAALYDALLAAGLVSQIVTEDGAFHSFQTAPGVDLDVIGVIHRATNVVDEHGAAIMEPTEGYHANLMADLSPEQVVLLPLVSAPATPYRVWA